MARRNRSIVGGSGLDGVFEKIRGLLNTPLRSIGEELDSQLKFLKHAANVDAANNEILRIFFDQVSTVLQILPETFGERFWFDCQMIAAIQSSWNKSVQRLSGTILAKPDQEWSHKSVFIPIGNDRDKAKAINVISIPGRDDLTEVDLLEYPWMCHELAHNLFYYDDLPFVEGFNKSLDRHLGQLRLRAIADQGAAKSRSRATIERIANFWRPVLTQKNWAHEMAMDIVALWTCGPAFTDAFFDKVEDRRRDPYRVEDEHPPYAVRAMGILKATKFLGWVKDADRITKLLTKWRKSQWAKNVDNDYLALAEPKLIEATVECALATCERFELPKCDEREIKRIKSLVDINDVPSFGIDLILAAWIIRNRGDDDTYGEWEAQTVRSLSMAITQ